jgi:large subunit ribosomal protein L15
MDIGRAKKLNSPRKTRMRVGRGTGSGSGKLSGRGRDGAASRSGWSGRGVTGSLPIWRRLPKVGFSNMPFKVEYLAVNVSQLNAFPAGAVVTVEALRKAGMAKQAPNGGVKVLGKGELSKALTVQANAFSASAVAKIEAAGGKAELLAKPKPPVRHKTGYVAEQRAAAFKAADAKRKERAQGT